MRRARFVVLAAVVIVFSGCYHATIDTGLEPEPAAQTREVWASSWIAGLIPPKPVDAARLCEGRPAALVETQHSFLNQLVAALTGGIYTPITIEVTCAAA